jgi:DNA-binding transcriptional ArsR family regulator
MKKFELLSGWKPEEQLEIIHVGRVLNNKTCVKIYNQLKEYGEMNVGEITSVISKPQPTTSSLLKQLRLAKLVKSKRNGKQIYYSVL